MNRAFAFALLAACGGGSSPGNSPDGATTDGTVADARIVTRPTWMLEDVEPESPRFGQTYGIDAFTDHTVVVTLVEGF